MAETKEDAAPKDLFADVPTFQYQPTLMLETPPPNPSGLTLDEAKAAGWNFVAPPPEEK